MFLSPKRVRQATPPFIYGSPPSPGHQLFIFLLLEYAAHWKQFPHQVTMSCGYKLSSRFNLPPLLTHRNNISSLNFACFPPSSFLAVVWVVRQRQKRCATGRTSASETVVEINGLIFCTVSKAFSSTMSLREMRQMTLGRRLLSCRRDTVVLLEDDRGQPYPASGRQSMVHGAYLDFRNALFWNVCDMHAFCIRTRWNEQSSFLPTCSPTSKRCEIDTIGLSTELFNRSVRDSI